MMKKRKLDDYRYHERTKEVVHIIEAKQPDNYDPKNPEHYITYTIRSNKPRKHDKVTSNEFWFWKSFKKISKLKAKLLW